MKNNKIMGYKGLSQDMTATAGNGMKYEVGHTYKIPEGTEIIPCKNGFHFCRDLVDVQDYYTFASSRLFLVEATGNTIEHRNKTVCSEITIVRELTAEDILDYITKNTGLTKKDLDLAKNFDHLNWRLEVLLAKTVIKEYLDILVVDTDHDVRESISYVLTNNSNISVKEKMKYIDSLITDKDSDVRESVVFFTTKDMSLSDDDRIKYLDILITDSDDDIKEDIGYNIIKNENAIFSDKMIEKYLDILVADNSLRVRAHIFYTIIETSTVPYNIKKNI